MNPFTAVRIFLPELTRPGQLTTAFKNVFKTGLLNVMAVLNICFSALILTLITFSTTALASGEITIMGVTDYQEEQMLLFDADSHFTLPDTVIRAINHEVPLNFKTEIILSEKSRYFGVEYERTRASFDYQTRLYAEGMNRRYFLYNSRNQKTQSFGSLESALLTLGTLYRFPVIPLSELHSSQHYTLKIRISLDHWKLPAPLLIEALFKPHWRLSSDWYQVDIHSPVNWFQ